MVRDEFPNWNEIVSRPRKPICPPKVKPIRVHSQLRKKLYWSLTTHHNLMMSPPDLMKNFLISTVKHCFNFRPTRKRFSPRNDPRNLNANLVGKQPHLPKLPSWIPRITPKGATRTHKLNSPSNITVTRTSVTVPSNDT